MRTHSFGFLSMTTKGASVTTVGVRSMSANPPLISRNVLVKIDDNGNQSGYENGTFSTTEQEIQLCR